MGTNTTIGVYADPEYAEKVKSYAASKGISASKLIRSLLDAEMSQKAGDIPRAGSEHPLIALYRAWRPDLVPEVELFVQEHEPLQRKIIGALLDRLAGQIEVEPELVAKARLSPIGNAEDFWLAVAEQARAEYKTMKKAASKARLPKTQ